MTEQHTPSTQAAAAPAGPAGGTAAVGPLTIRDLAVLGAVLIIFIASLTPLIVTTGGSFNLWNTTNLFYVGIGILLPLATGALFLIRRFSPGTQLRLGSLSLDQFASVVAVFAAFFFFAGTATNFRVAYLVGLVGAVLLVLATTCSPWIPVLAADFAGREETPAHMVARDAVAPIKRPASPKPAAKQGAGYAPGGPDASGAAPAAAGWAGSRPAAGHASSGQIFTPAKDERAEAGVAGTGAAPAAAAAAAGAGAGSAAAGSADSGRVASAGAQGTASAGTRPAANTQPGAKSGDRTAAQNPEPAEAGPAAAAGTAAPSNAGTDTHTAASALAARGGSVQEPATVLNPKLAAPNKDATAAPAEATAPQANTAAPAPVKESIAATVDPKPAPAVIAEPFWFAVDRPQNVIDERTRQFIFKLTPGSWILALEDRGTSFLVQDSHGKTGLLLDLVGIERASDSQ